MYPTGPETICATNPGWDLRLNSGFAWETPPGTPSPIRTTTPNHQITSFQQTWKSWKPCAVSLLTLIVDELVTVGLHNSFLPNVYTTGFRHKPFLPSKCSHKWNRNIKPGFSVWAFQNGKNHQQFAEENTTSEATNQGTFIGGSDPKKEHAVVSVGIGPE